MRSPDLLVPLPRPHGRSYIKARPARKPHQQKDLASGLSLGHNTRQFMERNKSWTGALRVLATLLLLLALSPQSVFAGEADIIIPPLENVKFGNISGMAILYVGLVICVLGAVFGAVQ